MFEFINKIINRRKVKEQEWERYKAQIQYDTERRANILLDIDIAKIQNRIIRMWCPYYPFKDEDVEFEYSRYDYFLCDIPVQQLQAGEDYTVTQLTGEYIGNKYMMSVHKGKVKNMFLQDCDAHFYQGNKDIEVYIPVMATNVKILNDLTNQVNLNNALDKKKEVLNQSNNSNELSK